MGLNPPCVHSLCESRRLGTRPARACSNRSVVGSTPPEYRAWPWGGFAGVPRSPRCTRAQRSHVADPTTASPRPDPFADIEGRRTAPTSTTVEEVPVRGTHIAPQDRPTDPSGTAHPRELMCSRVRGEQRRPTAVGDGDRLCRPTAVRGAWRQRDPDRLKPASERGPDPELGDRRSGGLISARSESVGRRVFRRCLFAVALANAAGPSRSYAAVEG